MLGMRSMRWCLGAVLSAGALGQDVGDDAARAAWRKLSDEDRVEIAQWFSAECERLDTFQNALMKHVFRALPRARYDWPKAADELPLYDPKLHAPAQPIQRKLLKESSRELKRWRERVFAGAPPRRLVAGWRYDYSSGEVVRVGDEFDPERIFESGLSGLPPDLDLAEALVERVLDDGSLREVHSAFGHGYADRYGKAYPGVSLYDVWCSGAEMEMPDVECLGIVHDLYDDWDTWVAPVAEREHDALYARIGQEFAKARRHRGLRTALARAYLIGAPVMRDGYGPSTDRLHALWNRHKSDATALITDLPGHEEDWLDWWEATSKAIDDDPEVFRAGKVRAATLAADSARVRRVLIGVMTEYGALGD